jgi:hypothetical protein
VRAEEDGEVCARCVEPGGDGVEERYTVMRREVRHESDAVAVKDVVIASNRSRPTFVTRQSLDGFRERRLPCNKPSKVPLSSSGRAKAQPVFDTVCPCEELSARAIRDFPRELRRNRVRNLRERVNDERAGFRTLPRGVSRVSGPVLTSYSAADSHPR